MIDPFILVSEVVVENRREFLCRKAGKNYWSRDLKNIRLISTEKSANIIAGQLRYLNSQTHWGRTRNMVIQVLPLSQLEEWLNG